MRQQAAAVAFEVELAFQRFVDGLDDLAERFEVTASGPGFLGLEVRPDQRDASLVEFVFEAGASVALVRDQGAPGGVVVTEGDHVERGVAFIGLRASERVRDGQA